MRTTSFLSPEKQYARRINNIIERRGFPPTKYQEAIYKDLWLRRDGVPDSSCSPHLLIEAVAGSGKTTTIEDCLSFIPPISSIVILAYNAHIAKEMVRRNLPGSTLHSLCFNLLKESIPNLILNRDKVADILAALVPKNDYFSLYGPITKGVSLLKNLSVLPSIEDEYLNEIIETELIDKYNIEIPLSAFSVLRDVFRESSRESTVIDFDDMLYYALLLSKRGKLSLPIYDYIFVDESQDLNYIQIDLIYLLSQANPKCRVIFVGDRKQSIYGFRGANPEAIADIEYRFGAKTLPLSICWRCDKAIIDRAKSIVPQIEAAPNAGEGIVDEIPQADYFDAIRPGDFSLCRTNAPLISTCIQFLARGQKAVVLGKEIGRSLLTIAKKAYAPRTYKKHEGNILNSLETLRLKEAAKLDSPKHAAKLDLLNDKFACLSTLIESPSTTLQELTKKIDSIFSDEQAAITLSTVHKAKGLEADRVFLLYPEKLPLIRRKMKDWEKEQERNLVYIAVTRARHHLTYVITPEKEKE